MRLISTVLSVGIAVSPLMVSAQEVPASDPAAIRIAQQSPACKPLPVASAYFQEDGSVAAICGEPVIFETEVDGPLSDPIAVEIVEAARFCAVAVNAAYFAADGRIAAQCEGDATAFVPAVGLGIGPAVGLGAAVLGALLAGSGGGGSTPDTQ